MAICETATSNKLWCVVNTQFQAEKVAASVLSAQGVETYVPLIYPARKKPNSGRPLFPCYMFAHLDPDYRNITAIRKTQGVKYILPYSGEPESIDDDLIRDIREVETTINRRPYLNPGSKVLITEGQFAGLVATLERRPDPQMLTRVLLDILGKKLSLEIGYGFLTKVR